jgi:CheY-like chemotaxis protein/HPt (histidine-containing phosphotransfer) domain-containing protein
VGNSVKFTEKGGVSVLVSLVEGARASARVKFEIVDTGIGIPEALQDGLFAQFSQVDPSYTRRYGGTGLGLAISKKLTELMGGTIGFASTHGAGSSFWFALDLECAEGKTAATTPQPRGTPAPVLVVDDNPIASAMLERQLRAEGFSVIVAADAEAARAALARGTRARTPFAFALIDQQLGQGSGIALAEEIRRKPALKAIRLVLLIPLGGRSETGGAGPDLFAAVLHKPVSQSALAKCLMQLAEPGAIVTPAAAAGRGQAGAFPARSRPAAPPPAVADANLLLVEDSAVNQIVASAMLAKAVRTVDTANNGIEALAAIAAKDYDLILMDVAMPEMDGLEATRRIRAMPGPKGSVPIIAISAHALESDRQRCLAAGMDDYVTKPIDRAGLIAAVTRWLGDGKTRAGATAREAGPAVLDRATLDQLAADTDPGIAEELVRTFVHETVARLDQIAHAADKRDFTTLEREAHSLKSSSGTFGALALQEHAKALELACRDGSGERALMLVPPLRALVAAATAAMTRHFEDAR